MEPEVTVGRIVHVADEKGTSCAAIVTCVHGGGCINVVRFSPDGAMTPEWSVNKVSDAPKGIKDWNWPPRA